MRRAEPKELQEYAFAVMTAKLSEAELTRWLPVQFDEINDPAAAPEPSLGALVSLEDGDYVVLDYGRESKQLIVRISPAADANSVLASFFREVPLPITRVLWRRADVKLPKPSTANKGDSSQGSRHGAVPGTRASIDDRLNRIIKELIDNGITLAQAVEAFEGKYIVAAMTAAKGNVTQASRKLGVHRNSLHNKLRTQSMLNGFAESIPTQRPRLSHKRVLRARSTTVGGRKK